MFFEPTSSVSQIPGPTTYCLHHSNGLVFLDNGTFQTGLQWTPSGALQFVQNITNIGPASNPGLIQTATKPINGIEVQVKIASSGGGFVNCWLNGALVISATGLTTQTSANAYANQVQIGGQSGQFGGSDQGFYTDYLRVWDSTGTTQNAPVGFDVQPVTKLASKVGLTTQFTPNGLPANYQCVSVVPPNGGDFVAASIAGIHDDYGVPVAGFTTAPNQVVVSSYYQKTDSNTRTYTNGVLSGTAVGTGATFTANSGLTWVQSCIANDPATNQPWTAAGADAAHIYHTEVS